MPRSFRPTEEQREKVKSMAGFGLTHEQIATLMRLGSAVTLRKHFANELTRGPIEANANVRKTLFKMAKSGRNPGATMYWLKTRARWKREGHHARAGREPSGEVHLVRDRISAAPAAGRRTAAGGSRRSARGHRAGV